MNNLAIIKPVISEKSFASAGVGTYIFFIPKGANKKTVATSVHELFKVDVVSVNIVNIPGKIKRVGRKQGKRSDVRKALVKIKKGQSIAIFETSTTEKENRDKSQINPNEAKTENKLPKQLKTK